MAITVKYLTELGIEKEVAEKIFAERGKEIADEKAKAESATEELANANRQIETITAELNRLRENKASAEDWEAKFNQLQTDWDNEKESARLAQAEAVRKANLEARFIEALGDKKFSHPAIKNDYLNKFMEEVNKEENQGKADNEIFMSLTKDDAGAFVGNTVTVNLAGGKPMGTQRMSRAEIMKIKDPVERQTAIKNNIGEFMQNGE